MGWYGQGAPGSNHNIIGLYLPASAPTWLSCLNLANMTYTGWAFYSTTADAGLCVTYAPASVSTAANLASGTFSAQHGNGTTTGCPVLSGAVTTGAWHFMLAAFGPSGTFAYVKNAKTGVESYASGTYVQASALATNFYIGQNYNSYPATDTLFAEVAYWQSALGLTEARQLANGRNPKTFPRDANLRFYIPLRYNLESLVPSPILPQAVFGTGAVPFKWGPHPPVQPYIFPRQWLKGPIATVTGTAAGTFGKITSAVSGVVCETGTLVGTFGKLTSAVTAATGACGTEVATFGKLTSTITAATGARGTEVAAFGKLASTITAATGARGTEACTFGKITGAVTAATGARGTEACTFGKLTSVIAVATGARGTEACTFGKLTSVIAATTGARGTEVATFGKITSAIAAVVSERGTETATFRPLTGVITAATGARGAEAATFGKLTSIITSVSTAHGTAAASFGKITSAITAARGARGTEAATFGKVIGSIAGVSTIVGSAHASYGLLSSAASGRIVERGAVQAHLGQLSAHITGYYTLIGPMVAQCSGSFSAMRGRSRGLSITLPLNPAQILGSAPSVRLVGLLPNTRIVHADGAPDRSTIRK